MEVYSDGFVKFIEEDGGCFVNVSDHIVLLEDPLRINLAFLWRQFEGILREELRALLSLRYEDAVSRYPGLGFKGKHADKRRDVPLGFIRNGMDRRLTVLKDPALVAALVNLDLIPATTPHGKQRQRFPRSKGPMGKALDELDYETQAKVIEEVLKMNLDDVLNFGQRDWLGMDALHRIITGRRPAVEILSDLADMIERELAPVKIERGKFRGSGSGRAYAPLWFAVFLACRNVWLFPFRYISKMNVLYPDHLRPLLPILSVPPSCRDIADSMTASAPRVKSSLRQTVPVFAISALAGTMWSSRRFCPAALFEMKRLFGTSNGTRSSSINHVYRVLSDLFDVNIRQRGEARRLNGRKRQNSIEAFYWVDYPSRTNTKKASRILGLDVGDMIIPEHTKELAAEMRCLLNGFKVQHMRHIPYALDYFLIYTLNLDPSVAPRRLRDIRRDLHVVSIDSPHETFLQFLDDRCEPTRSRQSAIPKMLEIWKIAALRDGFAAALPCPFDQHDRVKGSETKNTKAGRALDAEVIDLLIEINRMDDWAFAKCLDTSYFLAKHPEGYYESVFWPASPIILEFTLRTGVRLRSARWFDSGEADEKTYDPLSQTYSVNESDTAISGRNEFVVRKMTLDDAARTAINGTWINLAKSGPYEIPYFPSELLEPVLFMRALQQKYNPIKSPIPAVDDKNNTVYTDLSQFPLVTPLFRTPDPLSATISEDQVRFYYKQFLKHAQPIVEARLGRPYPLVDLDLDVALSTIHDHRRSYVTNGDEAGVPMSVMQVLLGHASEGMTHRYNLVRDHRVHGRIQAATYDHNLIASVAEGSHEAISEMATQVGLVMGVDAKAARDLREMSSGARPFVIDCLAHCLCVNGDCSKGGQPKGGKAQPVFRPRACGGCRFAARSWAHRGGVVMRHNMLTLELRQSAARAANLNARIEKDEAAGRNVSALKLSSTSEDYFRRQLANELRLEKEWLVKIDVAARAARRAGHSPSAVILAGEAIDIDKVETSLERVHEFELLHMVMQDSVLLPASIIDLPSAAPLEYERHVRQILRANSLEECLYRIPPEEKTETLIAIGGVLLNAFGDVGEMQRLVESSANNIPDPAIEVIATQITTAVADKTSRFIT